MNNKHTIFLCISCLLCAFVTFSFAYGGSKAVTVINEEKLKQSLPCIIIDAGHGGEDGGAISCTGAYESEINLEICKKLNALFALMGFQTKMLRSSDTALYTSGTTISSKKVSDLKERVRIINDISNGILLSIHQNKFTDSRYSGAQVFYSKGSDDFAKEMQTKLVATINTGSNRKIKPAKGIYIMEHIQCPGILIECGFLSNEKEEKELRSSDYQNKLCSVISAVTSEYIRNACS